MRMRHLLHAGIFGAVICFGCTANLGAQNLSLIDKFCIPQHTEASKSAFEFLKKAGVKYAESKISSRLNGDYYVTDIRIWPDEEVSVLYNYENGRELDSIRLYSPVGCFGDNRSFHGDRKIPEKLNLGRVSVTHRNPDIKFPSENYIEYPPELKYLAFSSLNIAKDLANVTLPVSENRLENYLVEEGIDKILAFAADPSEGEVSGAFSVKNRKISITREGPMLKKLEVESPNYKISVENTFVCSDKDPKYAEFNPADFYNDNIYNGGDSFGLRIKENGGKYFIEYMLDWSRTLYRAYKPINFEETAISKIDGKDVYEFGLQQMLEYLKHPETQSMAVEFENGKKFTFQKLTAYEYIPLDSILRSKGGEIFWE